MAQFSLKKGSYWAPTPKSIRKLADALLAGAMTVSTISFANDYKTIAMVVLITAGIAKFLSNFFCEDTETPAAPQN
jgi:hypothetical protein